jgi:hypothetical protein
MELTADIMLRTMRTLPEGIYTVKADQRLLIMAYWHNLHQFDPQHEYTMNSSLTKIRKDKRP